MTALEAITRFQEGDLAILKNQRWLLYLAFTDQHRVNPERLNSMGQAKENYALQTVSRQLCLLKDLKLPDTQKAVLEEAIKWSEVAKGGLPHQRKQWIQSGYNLFVHNIGSAQIYKAECLRSGNFSPVVETLIKTHGLIGQTIRGEVNFSQNRPLYDLITNKQADKAELSTMLRAFNYCIIAAVDVNLWESVKATVFDKIDCVVNGRFDCELPVKERLRALRSSSIQAGEDFEKTYAQFSQNALGAEKFAALFEQCDLWYVEAALYDFSFEEFIKVFLLACRSLKDKKVSHLSFEKVMAGLYYDRNGKKYVNLYKKRIIEKYLAAYSVEDILNGTSHESPHIRHKIETVPQLDDTAFFVFEFSPAGERLIAFCMEAEKSGVLYEKSIIMLYDLFDLRKDAYDRFYEEENYLKTMNQSIDGKRVLLKYITGKSILDIGPGGGALMDLIEEQYPQAEVTGIDIAENVIRALRQKKQSEKKKWNVMQGDAFHLSGVLKPGDADTIIFCSIIHELFSYIETDGRKFNKATIAGALKSAFDVLSPGGRILIRDGIMTEPVSLKRRIRFASDEGMDFLKRYAHDFQGRSIQYESIGRNEVLMPVNDAMEFLYTYTWGEESYVHEINEQFGYFTPSEYCRFITETLGEQAKILECRHYLQDGYPLALSQKISFSDENGKRVQLPDSTCLIVIEKIN
ncbi:class I SAM-dependent methyltransferase [Caproiciproducens galactitolivorans]|uniref:Class I SAM-dependent methyltransferase n=1 Tax=Caproiciproducens galactitolivorans TaxID=642589 RepID=A0ABT4BR75_9FIRM|nr:class I SAM-dependent methyltransferase [Caproiciproducens galactitolivorans]MCY1713390.1 class I SAM-dependent methyltransferase [Caproiciproducens galactitolivorans]